MAPKRPQNAESPSTPDGNPAKRQKASRACATCRKTKSRCELLDVAPGVNGRIQCHRCKVLDIECSFHNSDIIIVARHNDAASTTSQAGSSTPGQQVSAQSTRSSPSTEQLGVRTSLTGNNTVELPPEGQDSYVLGPWRLLGIADDAHWMKEPILATEGILPLLPAHDINGPLIDRHCQSDTLESILPRHRIRYLIDIFEARYRPWMDLPSADVSDASLDLVRCTVASRHLESTTRLKVAPRLQRLVESTLLQPGYPHTKTPEFIEALLILALWSPICGSGYAIERDSRLLASSAMQIAVNLGLDQYDNIQTLLPRKAQGKSDPEVIRKTRLWCAASNIEHLLLFGTGLDPRSRRTLEERRTDYTASYAALDPRDIRLGLSRRLFDLTDIGSSVYWGDSLTEQEDASKEVTDLLASYNWLRRLIIPLPVIFQLDAFYFSMLEVLYHAYKMKIIYRNLFEVKSLFHLSNPEWLRFELNGQPVGIVWGRELVTLSEATLVSLLSRPDIASLSTAPDCYFLVITYAGLSLLTTKIAVHQLGFPWHADHGDSLLVTTMERLQQAALSPDHMPARCAVALRNSIAIWEKLREESPPIPPTRNSNLKDAGRDKANNSSEAQTQQAPMTDSGDDLDDPLPTMFDPFFGTMGMAEELDPGLIFDPQFWSSFINTRMDPSHP
ncbi:Zinc cluster transcription factor 02 [Pleurotus pulmonarius]